MISLIECEIAIGLLHKLEHKILINEVILNCNEIEEKRQIESFSAIKEEIRKIDFLWTRQNFLESDCFPDHSNHQIL